MENKKIEEEKMVRRKANEENIEWKEVKKNCKLVEREKRKVMKNEMKEK